MNSIDTTTLEGKIAVMMAFKEGRAVECKYVGIPDKWDKMKDPGWDWVGCEYRIKPLEFPPLPEGLEWHLGREEEIDPESVGTGYRPAVKGEILPGGTQFLYRDSGDESKEPEFKQAWRVGKTPHSDEFYRVPISTPFPEPPKKKMMVPLGPEDVPPGSYIRKLGSEVPWAVVLRPTKAGVWHPDVNDCSFTYWASLYHCGWEILRPGEDWQPCEKPASETKPS